MGCIKRILCIIICMTMLLYITACGKTTSNGLMKDASPITSTLVLYVYDGEKVSSYILKSNTQSVLSTLNSVKAKEVKNWSLEDITLPVYGIQMGSTDGTGIFAAWTNGYWIAMDGTVYSFDFDFAKLQQEYNFDYLDEFSSASVLPCSRLLTQDKNGWYKKLLTPSVELNHPDGVTMQLESWDKETVTVNFINNSGSEWSYGEYYSIEVLLDGTWYDVPTVPGNWGFYDIGLNLKDGKKQTKAYGLTMYGNLPAGTYRLVANGLFVESTLS